MCDCLGAVDSGRSMSDGPCDAGAGSTCQPGGVSCPPDFQVDAPCRVLKKNGGFIRITVSELGGYSGGDFTWSTSSSKITLSGTFGTSITVLALHGVSTAKDAEVIAVTRTATGCPPLTKTVNVTVARVTFSQSAHQCYGYDNYDTPNNHDDDHINVKQSDHTFVKVTIEGGLTGADFDFVSDAPLICSVGAAPATAEFDLQLNGGTTDKGDCILSAQGKCASAINFRCIAVHVYKERVVDVVIEKIDHPNVRHRHLRFPTANYAAHEATANAKLKQGVVKYNLSNFRADNGITPITFASGNGTLTYDIAAGGGPDFDAINSAMTGTGTKVRVAIIRNMRSFYYLSAAAARGATSITITAVPDDIYLQVYDPTEDNTYRLASGRTHESIKITAITGSTLTCEALHHHYPAGACI